MKVVSIAVTCALIGLLVLTLIPPAGDYRSYAAVTALAAALVVLLMIVVGWREKLPTSTDGTQLGGSASNRNAESAPARVAESAPARVAESAPARLGESAPAPAAANQAQAEIVGFLAVLQEKGRLVDFLTDDITRYSDAQVGAAARVVHQGCKAVLGEHFHIVPVRAENEGSRVTVEAGYAADEYRLVGKISGQAPFSGTLMHRGWKTDSVNLPRTTRIGNNRLPTIAPAEVELT